jgi:hypothetical protein
MAGQAPPGTSQPGQYPPTQSSAFGGPPPSQSYPGQPYPGQPAAPGQSYPGQPGTPGQPYPGQPAAPGQSYPGQPGTPGQSYAGQPAAPGAPGTSYPPAGPPPGGPYGPPPAGYQAAGYPYPQGVYGGPPPSRPRRRGLFIGIAAGLVVIIVVAVVAVVLLKGTTESDATMAHDAAKALAKADGLNLDGTIGGSSANINVTKAGSVQGTYTQDGQQISRLTVQGQTYLNAPTAFWTSEIVGKTLADQAGGTWAKAPSRAVNMSFTALTPAKLADPLKQLGPNVIGVQTRMDGHKVIRLTENGVKYYITTAKPNRVIQISGVANKNDYNFALTDLNTSAIAPVLSDLISDVRKLQNAPDPAAIILPKGKIKFFPDCKSASNCTVTDTVTILDASATTLYLRMFVQFSGTKDGESFATCQVTDPTSTVATLHPECGVSGATWNLWFISHTGIFHTWAKPHFYASVNSAGDITALVSELDQEKAAS